jgi:hypothetical protein
MIDRRALRILESTPVTLSALLAGHDYDALTTPADEGWSLHHVIAHIVDVDQVIYTDRIHRILTEDRPFIRSIDPLERLTERALLDRDIGKLIDDLAARRPDEIAALRTLNAQQLGRTGDHDEAGEITVSDLIHQWAYHDLMHLKQAGGILQAPLVVRMGNTRRFYDL